MLQTKSILSPTETRRDGLRILVARYRGRGLPAAKYDVWMANLGPSETLLRAWLAKTITWAEFSARYRREMLGLVDAEPRNPRLKNRGQKFTLRLLRELARRGPVTLLCHCAENEAHCHRHVLQRLIARA